ncbi:MAG: hypothetical protein JHD28_03670 [Bacteroidia bacterium]|nr:hypothetical protein [Bacteroidia bacterium]
MENNEDKNTELNQPKKAANNYEDFDTYYANRQTALVNASDAQVAPLLTAADYPPATIAAKLAELEALKKLSDDQKKEYGEQYEATKKFNELAISLHPIYLTHVNYGKLIFEDDKAAIKVLGLDGKRKRAEMAYCNQALDFYENGLSNATYKAALNKRGITDAELTAGKTGFTNLKAMIPVKAKETGEAQQATSKRDAAWEIFDEWFVKFKKYAVLALSGTPQLKEKLGWKE